MYTEALLQLLDTTLARATVPNLRSFLSFSGVTKWLIASDFVIDDKTRNADVFAFSLIPCDDTIQNLCSEIDAASKLDIKGIRKVRTEMLDLLRSPRRFHFVLVVDRHRSWPNGVAEARATIDETLRIMRSWEDAASQTGAINGMLALRNEANANSFNYRLLGDITLTCAVAGYFAAMLVREHGIEAITWAPDRDKITTAYKRIASTMFSINFSAMCQRWGIGRDREARVLVGYAYEPDDRKPMWFDSLVRIPDFLAGAVSAWNIDENEMLSDREKYTQVIQGAIADNPNIEILRLRVQDGGGMSLSRFVTSGLGV